ncbi:MAG TPA: nucleotidyltransferase domain-containing protein [Candidatus Thermoplasmatota archaeon]|nr:nucleotidyltransferase domain-containing protein [Candidatus Thermoplasmatota archaeon]
MAVDVVLADRLRSSLQREPDVVFAYLFGSQARGDALARSDVDVAVYLREGSDLDILQVMSLIEGVGKRHLDVILLDRAPPFISYEALHGLLLFSRDDETRVLVEARIAREYLDREPSMRRDLRETLDRFAAEGFG